MFLTTIVAAFLLLAVAVRSYSGSTIIAGDMGNDPAISSQWQFGYEIVDSSSEGAAEVSQVPASNGQVETVSAESGLTASADEGIFSLLAPIQIVAAAIFVTSATIYLYQKLYLAPNYKLR